MDNEKIDLIKKNESALNTQLNASREAIQMCETQIRNIDRQLLQIDSNHKAHQDDFNRQRNRFLNTIKLHTKILDDLIKEKSVLHDELKTVLHEGESQCEWCGKYFTEAGLSRHQAACTAKPEKELLKQSKDSLTKDEEDRNKKREQLQKLMKELENT